MVRKNCSVCHAKKTADYFYKDINKTSGLSSICKVCAKEKREQNNKELHKMGFVSLNKMCPTCKIEKKSTGFRNNKNRPDGLFFECKSCAKERRLRKKSELQLTLKVPSKKVCFTCVLEKPSSSFNKDAMSKDGLCFDCKDCYNEKNQKSCVSRGQEYIKKNRKRARDWYQKNKEHVKAYQRKYNKENHEYVQQRQLKREKERYYTDINFNIQQRLRKRLRVALRQKYFMKYDSTFNLLGCSLDDFKTYLESRFEEGMTWELFMNGKIHIDHIIPCNHFNLGDPTEQKICFYVTNLRPLWGPDNILKKDKIDYAKDGDAIKDSFRPFHATYGHLTQKETIHA